MKKIRYHRNVVDNFKDLSFYDKHIENPKVKRLKNVDFLSELLFYKELNVIKINHAFRRYAISYKVKLIEKKDPITQLKAHKSRIKDFFSDLLNETEGYKYQITVKVTLKNTSQMEELNLLHFVSI